MIKASYLVICATCLASGGAAAQTANEQTGGVTTPITGGTMAIEGSDSPVSDDPTVTLGDGTTTTGDTVGTGDMADAGDPLIDGSDGGDPLPDGAFSQLSPGNQKIVRALFDAQSAPTTGDSGTTLSLTDTGDNSRWTLDQIAQAKQHTGFGRLFKDMQDAGVIPEDVKNLGQLVSGKYQPSDAASDPTTVTEGGGEAGSGDGSAATDSGASLNEATTQATLGKGEVTSGAGASGAALKSNHGRAKRSDLVITTGSGRQVHIGAASKSKAKNVAAGSSRGGKQHARGGRAGGSASSGVNTVVTTGSGAQAAMGAGRALGHSKGVTTGAGRSAAGGGHAKGVHSGKGSGKIAVTGGRGGGKGLGHTRGGGKAKGKFK